LTCLLQGFSHNPDEDCAHFTFEQSMYHLTLYQSSDLFHSILSVLVSIGELSFEIKKIEEAYVSCSRKKPGKQGKLFELRNLIDSLSREWRLRLD